MNDAERERYFDRIRREPVVRTREVIAAARRDRGPAWKRQPACEVCGKQHAGYENAHKA